MAANIFISLTVHDTPLAIALRSAFRQLLGDSVQVHFSTSKELSGGIQHGEDWFSWIVSRVKECDFALIIVTPTSVQKPWILWEAGAVHGAAVATGNEGLRKVRPLIYQLTPDQVPSPIRESKVQLLRGDLSEEVEAFFTSVLDQYRGELTTDRFRSALKALDATIATYLAEVSKSLLDTPALPEPVVVDEWRLRLDTLLQTNRASEVEHLHDWMDIAFGRDSDGQRQPLDLRIHSRLAELYLKAQRYDRAIQQLELSRRLAPRDIFVLRTLGRAYLESGDRTSAKTIIDRIAELDKTAWTHNIECAALVARWHREVGNSEAAAELLTKALEVNPRSYYLANVLGETSLEAGRLQDARHAFEQALTIIDGLPEANIWTNATAANAAFVLHDDDRARVYLARIASAKPDADTQAIVERGLTTLAGFVDGGRARLAALLRAEGDTASDAPPDRASTLTVLDRPELAEPMGESLRRPNELRSVGTIRIASYNIRGLSGQESGSAAPREQTKAVADLILEIDPDVIAFAEVESEAVLRSLFRTHVNPNLPRLDKYTGLVWLSGHGRRAANVALVTRLAIRGSLTFRDREFSTSEGATHSGLSSDLIGVKIQMTPDPAHTYLHFAAHLKSSIFGVSSEGKRGVEAAEIVGILTESTFGPTPFIESDIILTGGMNDDPGTSVIDILSAKGRLSDVLAQVEPNHTYPTQRTHNKPGHRKYPPTRLDYFFASPSMSKRLSNVTIHRGEAADRASDHYPISADLRVE